MKKNGWTDTRLCPECEEPVRVAFYPGCRAKTYGRPEEGYPAEGPDLDYEDTECKGCGYEFTENDVDRWIEQLEEERSGRDDRY